MQIQREIKALENQLIEWRRAFHQHPESSLKEYETVYPACGSEFVVAKFKVDELKDAINAQGWVDIGK